MPSKGRFWRAEFVPKLSFSSNALDKSPVEGEGDEIPLVEYNTASWEAVEAEVQAVLRRELNATFVSVRDAGGCGTHVEVIVESPRFIGMDKLKQHQTVQHLIKEIIDGVQAHAISIYTRTPKS